MVSRAYTWHPCRGGSAADWPVATLYRAVERRLARFPAGGGRRAGRWRRAAGGGRCWGSGGGRRAVAEGLAQDWLGSFAGGRRFCARDRTCARSHPCEIRGRSLSVSDGGARGSYLPYLATVYGLRARGGQRGTAGGFLTATCKRLVAIRSQRSLLAFLSLGFWGGRSHRGAARTCVVRAPGPVHAAPRQKTCRGEARAPRAV